MRAFIFWFSYRYSPSMCWYSMQMSKIKQMVKMLRYILVSVT